MGIEIGRSEDLGQILKYCSEKLVPFGVITNGSQWILFDAFGKRQTLTDSTVWKIDIEHDDLEIISDMFNALSRTAIENIAESSKILQKKIKKQNTLKKDLEKMMEETLKKIESEPDLIVKAFLPVFKSLMNKSDLTKYKIGDPQISEFVKDKTSRSFGNMGDTYPQIKRKSEKELAFNANSMILVIKGEKYSIAHQREILIKTANWLIRNGKLQKANCPISVTRGTRNLINSEPVHKNNKKFTDGKPLDCGLWVETNNDYENTVKYARKLFEHFGYQGNDIQVE